MKRLVAILAFAGITIAGAALCWHATSSSDASRFFGEMHLEPGQPRCLALAPAMSPTAVRPKEHDAVYHDVPGRNIAENHPEWTRRVVDPAARYDVAYLPFFLRLERIAILKATEPRTTLELAGPNGSRPVEIRPGAQVEVDGIPLTVSAIRRWYGLVSSEDGFPATEVSIRRSGETWTEHVIIPDSNWRRLEPAIGLRFRWHASEEVARAALEDGLPGLNSARWGVALGGQVHWVASFVPGAGLDPIDGVGAALVAYEEQYAAKTGHTGPAICVDIVRDGQTSRNWYPANVGERGSPVRFDYPAALETVYLIEAWKDGKAAVAAYRNGERCGQADRQTGEIFLARGSEFDLRIDHALHSALPVSSEDSTLYEAILESPERRWRVPENRSVWIGNTVVQFRWECDVPPCRYDLAIIDSDSKRITTLAVAPGDTFDHGGWSFTCAPPDPRQPNTITTTIELSPRTGKPILGLALIGIGLIGLIRPIRLVGALRRARPRA